MKSLKSFVALAGISFFLLSSQAGAVLPPLYQSIREYTALLNSPELANHFGSGQAISDIQRQESGFIVKGTKSILEAKVIYDPMDYVGPAKFHFEFSSIEE